MPECLERKSHGAEIKRRAPQSSVMRDGKLVNLQLVNSHDSRGRGL